MTSPVRNADEPPTQRIKPIRLRHLFSVNCYLVTADKGYVLVDTGFAPGRRALETELHRAGCGRDDLRLVVLTHGHTDHAGNCAWLRKTYGAPVAMHVGDLEKVRRGDMFWGSGNSRPATAVARTMLALAGMGSFEPFEPDLLLADGQDLGDYGIDAAVLALPGHTPGSIGVRTGAGDLLCGDLLVNTRRPAQNALAEDATRLAASVEALAGRDVRVVYPGHGSPFSLASLTGGLRPA